VSKKDETDPDSLPWLGRKFLWVDNPANVKRLYQGLIVVCVALFLTDFVYARHGNFEFEHFWGYFGVFGFVAFCMVIFGAKSLRVLIKRDENYYAPHVIDTEEYPEQGLDKASHLDD
jgi:hypothetical protein